MTGQKRLSRRGFVAGAVAVGTAVGLAGCGSDSVGHVKRGVISYGETIQDELAKELPNEPKYNNQARPYDFEAEADDVARITMSSDEFDTYLLLGNSEYEIISENNDSNGTNSELIRGLPQAGTYTMWASAFEKYGTGEFSLSLSRGSRSDLIPEEATAIQKGDTVNGRLTPESPRDPYYREFAVPYTFQGTSGEQITVSMESGQTDTYLLITDRNGGLIAEDNDSGSGTNSQLTQTLPRDGTYVIWAENYAGNGIGRFTLSVEGEAATD
jgi:hypothetical protein